MGCGCNKATVSSMRYLYVAPNGHQVIYDKEIQAMAAKIRDGGKGTVTPIPR